MEMQRQIAKAKIIKYERCTEVKKKSNELSPILQSNFKFFYLAHDLGLVP